MSLSRSLQANKLFLYRQPYPFPSALLQFSQEPLPSVPLCFALLCYLVQLCVFFVSVFLLNQCVWQDPYLLFSETVRCEYNDTRLMCILSLQPLHFSWFLLMLHQENTFFQQYILLFFPPTYGCVLFLMLSLCWMPCFRVFFGLHRHNRLERTHTV